MAVIAVISAKGSPGVTTTCLAMTLAWPRPVLLVEADPAGGDILAGYLRGQLAMDRGLVGAAVAARHNRLVEDFTSHLLDLAKPNSPVSRVLLPGLSDPAQAATVAPMWDVLATHFAKLAQGASDSDIIVDCGRLATNYPPLHVLAAADAVLLVVRATLRSASTATAAIAAARVGLGTTANDRLGLIVVDSGEYKASELAKALRAPVVATMPWRPSEAAALSDGVGRVSGSSALLRAARSIDVPVRARIADRQARSSDGLPPSAAGSSSRPGPGGPAPSAARDPHPSASTTSMSPTSPSPAAPPPSSTMPVASARPPSQSTGSTDAGHQVTAGASR